MAKQDQAGQEPRNTLNRQMVSRLALVIVLMFGFGYALIPIYKKICEVTGINVLTKETDAAQLKNTQVDKSRLVTIEFDANVRGPWRFRPTKRSVTVHPGELTQVVYEVVNTEARSVDAQAIPSYAPQQVAAHFKKVECFCFQQQTLGPKEARQMPVMFYIDPALPKSVQTITLSYTFFEIDKAGKKTS